MGQVLHGRARTTQAIQRSIQRSQESLQALAKRHSIDPKTVAKWRKRTTTTEAPMGPKKPKKKFKDYPIGYLHVDFAEVHIVGKAYLYDKMVMSVLKAEWMLQGAEGR